MAKKKEPETQEELLQWAEERMVLKKVFANSKDRARFILFARKVKCDPLVMAEVLGLDPKEK